ncbi:unnamed protein product [Meganyctiphanes norvegica]|uniref:Uncharacterized protein n=1 Tax=Meganyctiphanes norvegica TaxID=48144 RepID=A0AAV2R7Q4_MEGNR
MGSIFSSRHHQDCNPRTVNENRSTYSMIEMGNIHEGCNQEMGNNINNNINNAEDGDCFSGRKLRLWIVFVISVIVILVIVFCVLASHIVNSPVLQPDNGTGDIRMDNCTHEKLIGNESDMFPFRNNARISLQPISSQPGIYMVIALFQSPEYLKPNVIVEALVELSYNNSVWELRGKLGNDEEWSRVQLDQVPFAEGVFEVTVELIERHVKIQVNNHEDYIRELLLPGTVSWTQDLYIRIGSHRNKVPYYACAIVT